MLECAASRVIAARSEDAIALIGAAAEQGAGLVALSVAALPEDFFRLRTGLAGQFLQKFVTYGVRVAILGDFEEWTAASVPLRDFIRESNRGSSVWFLRDQEELRARLTKELTGTAS